VQSQVPHVSSPQVSPAADRVRRLVRYDRLRELILANRLFALALAAGAVLRLLAVLGYPGALWFAGDSYVYLGSALRLRPDLSKATGYSLFLKVLEPFHSLTLVVVIQHLMGLAVGVLIYVLLRRARVPKLWASLATLPVLLNGFEIQLEHMIMADLLFLFVLVVAVTLLLWHRRPSWPAVLIAGLLAGYAITVWPGGLAMPVVFFIFLIARRVGWRSLAAIVAGSAIPVVGYAIWFHSRTGTYGLSQSEGFYLYGRTSSFAECSKINPPANERVLCLSTPPAERQPPGSLVWHVKQVHQVPGGPVSVTGNKLLRDFAIRAVEAQPLSYAHAIVNGLVLAIEPQRHPYPSKGTVAYYYFHLKPQKVPNHSWIPHATAPQDIRAYGHVSISRVVEPFAFVIAAYGRVFYLYGPLFGLILVLGLGAVVRVRRHPGRGLRLERRRDGLSMLPWVSAVVLLIFPIATADFDYRYLLPVVPFACLAAGLAFAAPASRPGRTDPQPSGAEAVPGEPATVTEGSSAVGGTAAAGTAEDGPAGDAVPDPSRSPTSVPE
jgi:hypothetical protein